MITNQFKNLLIRDGMILSREISHLLLISSTDSIILKLPALIVNMFQ